MTSVLLPCLTMALDNHRNIIFPKFRCRNSNIRSIRSGRWSRKEKILSPVIWNRIPWKRNSFRDSCQHHYHRVCIALCGWWLRNGSREMKMNIDRWLRPWKWRFKNYRSVWANHHLMSGWSWCRMESTTTNNYKSCKSSGNIRRDRQWKPSFCQENVSASQQKQTKNFCQR